MSRYWPATPNFTLFSGYSHGAPFAHWRELTLAIDGNAQLSRNPAINERSFKNATGIASYALHPAAHRLTTRFGF